MKHEHPLRILKFSAKSIWLLIFPLLRGIRSMQLDVGAFYQWLRGAWFDLLVLLVILTVGWVRWQFTTFEPLEDAVVYRSGVLVKRRTVIPYSKITAVTAEHPLLLRPFFAVRVYIDTRAGTLKSSDLKLLVRRSDYRFFRTRLLPTQKKDKGVTTYRPRLWLLVAFSIIFSSSLSGVVYVATFFFQSSKILDTLLEESIAKRLAEMTTEVTAEVSGKIATYTKFANSVPPIAIAVAIVLMAAWLLSFGSNMLRYIGFRYEQDEAHLRIRTGLLTKRHYSIIIKRVNYIDLRQNLLMKLFCLMSVHISCPGYGKATGELPVLIPVISRRQVMKMSNQMFPRTPSLKNQIRPGRDGFMRFIYLPFWIAVVLPFAAHILQPLVPSVTRFITFLLIMTEIPSIWVMLVRIGAWLTTGVSLQNGKLCIRYCNGIRFHTILADGTKLVTAQIIATPFQKMVGKCDMYFNFQGEHTHSHRVYGLYRKDAEELLHRLSYQRVSELDRKERKKASS